MKIVELKPIAGTVSEFEQLERRIRLAFKRLLYAPLLAELQTPAKVLNSRDALLEALRTGQVTFQAGVFGGRFSAEVTKGLRKLGARWDPKSSTFRLAASSLPMDVKAAIGASSARFEERLKAIDARLAKFLPEEIADSVRAADLFDSSLWKTSRELRKTLERITIQPELTAEQRERIATEWQFNLDRWIKDFAADEIPKLRKAIQKNAFKGDRYEAVVSSIRRSFGVTERKARFLARQETNLLLTKFKEARYTEAGVTEYRWGCVVGSKHHPVRPSHKKLEGRIFSWNDPPITTEPGASVRRNNPGEDFNCRCFARPIVRFTKP